MFSRSKKTLFITISMIVITTVSVVYIYVENKADNLYESNADETTNSQAETSKFEVIPSEGSQPATE
jgi:hypothetical protein